MNYRSSLLALALCLGLTTQAQVLPPEKLLPADTLAVFTMPDYAKVTEAAKSNPFLQFLGDPAMKAFTDKFKTKFTEEIIGPMEKELGIKVADYTDLARGQVTVAVVQNGWQGKSDVEPALIIMVDSKDQSEKLKQILTDLKKKWVDGGKTLKTEKIQEFEFTTIVIDPKPATKTDDEEEDGEDAPAPKKQEFTIGQANSLLILSDKPKVIEKILIKQSGGLVPTLSEQAIYEKDHQAMFRSALSYGWINAAALVDVLNKVLAAEAANAEPNPMGLTPDKIVSALGINELKSIAFQVTDSPEGSLSQMFIGVPESKRKGLFQLLNLEAKDSAPPAFVGADVVRFNRWRLDGQKLWAAIENIVKDINPQLNMMLQMTTDSLGKDKDPNFDFKKSFIGNLGDDVITLVKSPRGKTLEELNSPPQLVLVGSPNPGELIQGVKAAMGLMPSESGLQEREFLGKKIYSLPLPSAGGAQAMNIAAGNGYVGFSADAAFLEEFLRSGENPAKPLRETAGLAEAAEKVGGMNSGLFGYENAAETMRVVMEVLKQDGDRLTEMFNQQAGLGDEDEEEETDGAEKKNNLKDWADFALLPSYDQIAKYFHIGVFATSSTSDGLSLKYYAPMPPQLKK